MLVLAAFLSVAAAAAPSVTIGRATGPIHLDGRLDEPSWAAAPAVDDFVQYLPAPGGDAPGHAAHVTGAPGAPESASLSVSTAPVPSKAPLASTGWQSPRMSTVAPAGAGRTAACARRSVAQGLAAVPAALSLPALQST